MYHESSTTQMCQKGTVGGSTRSQNIASQVETVDSNMFVLPAKVDTQYIRVHPLPKEECPHKEDLHLRQSPEMLTNHQTVRLPTPIRPERLQHHLIRIGYDQSEIDYLVQGFTSGFKLGHDGPISHTEPENDSSVDDLQDIINSAKTSKRN